MSARVGGSGRAGFSLVEIIVSLVILGLLTAALTPQVIARLNEARSATLLGQLNGLRGALIGYRQDVGRYPLTLRQLSAEPAAGARDLCGRPVPSGAWPDWKGPYVQRDIPATGIPVAGSTIASTLRRSPAGYTTTGTLYIDVLEVDWVVAEAMEREMDGNADLAGGTILWQQGAAAGRGTLSMAVPVRGC